MLVKLLVKLLVKRLSFCSTHCHLAKICQDLPVVVEHKGEHMT